MSHKQPSATCPVVVGYGDDDNGSLDGDVVKQLRGNTASVDLQNLPFVETPKIAVKLASNTGNAPTHHSQSGIRVLTVASAS